MVQIGCIYRGSLLSTVSLSTIPGIVGIVVEPYIFLLLGEHFLLEPRICCCK